MIPTIRPMTKSMPRTTPVTIPEWEGEAWLPVEGEEPVEEEDGQSSISGPKM